MKIRINSLKETKTKALLITTLTLTAALISLAFINLGAAQTADFTITASPSNLTIPAGSTGASTITVTSINGFSGTVSLTDTVPAGLTCSMSPSAVTLGTGGTATATISCTSSVCATYTVTITGTSGSLSHSTTVTYNFTCPSAPPECASGVGIDLSTGTNGFTSPNGADAVGTQDTAWKVASAPAGVPTGTGSAYSVHPLGWGTTNKIYATSPYVYPGTAYITGFSGNGGGPMGRINWISYGPSFSNSSGSFSNEPNLFGSSPGLQYNYTLSFTATLPAAFTLFNFTADNSIALTLKDPSSNTLQTWKSPNYPDPNAGDFSAWWWSPPAPLTIALSTTGPYTLIATVENGVSTTPTYTAFAVYAVVCHQKSPTITTTLLPASTVFAGGAVTDSAILSGATTNAGGKVTYEFFAGSSCTFGVNIVGTPVTVTGGVVPNSAAHIFPVGTFSWNAVYSGDVNNNAATSPCETLTVLPTPKSVFTVKFVCNTISPSAASSIGLEPGLYNTDINIHNPSFSASNLTLVEKFVIATPQLVSLGPPPNVQTVSAVPTPYVIREVTLEPDAAVQINCAQILSYLGVTSGTAKGFVMIYTGVAPTPANQATVWAEYSAADSSGFGVRSLQLVQVQPTGYVP